MSGLPSALARHPDLDQWLAVDAADTVTVATGKVEIGQGITTALALIAAHELGLDPRRVRVRTAHTGITPNEFITAGSMSVEDSGGALRQACAHARRLILARAAERLGTDARAVAVHGADLLDPLHGRDHVLRESGDGVAARGAVGRLAGHVRVDLDRRHLDVRLVEHLRERGRGRCGFASWSGGVGDRRRRAPRW